MQNVEKQLTAIRSIARALYELVETIDAQMTEGQLWTKAEAPEPVAERPKKKRKPLLEDAYEEVTQAQAEKKKAEEPKPAAIDWKEEALNLFKAVKDVDERQEHIKYARSLGIVGPLGNASEEHLEQFVKYLRGEGKAEVKAAPRSEEPIDREKLLMSMLKKMKSAELKTKVITEALEIGITDFNNATTEQLLALKERLASDETE
jgi:hypothetical protein